MSVNIFIGGFKFMYQDNNNQFNYNAPPQYGNQWGQPQREDPGKGMALASLILGIASLVMPYAGVICGILGLVFAIVSKKKSADTGFIPSGMSTAGMICSIIGLALWVIIIIYALVILGSFWLYL